MFVVGCSKFTRLGSAFFSRSYSSRRQVLSVALDWTREKDPPISLGQSSIVANLKRHNIPVIAKSWSVNHSAFDVGEVFSDIMQYADTKTDLALGAFVWHEPETQILLNRLKAEGFPGRIILGGPQISYTKLGVEKYYPQADIFIRGYGEEALARLMMSNEDKPVISGVHYAGEFDFGRSASADLEELPSPFLTDVIKPQSFIRWETQRGCPFQCAFCQHRESDVSMKRRQFSQLRIFEEIDWFLSNPVINDIAVLDPTFNSGPHYLSILHKFIEGGYRGKLALQCRAEMVKDEFLNAVEELNRTANVVLEFGLQTIHREEQRLVQRPTNMKKVERVFNETRVRNIATEVSLIFGLPGQTVDSFQSSIDFCKQFYVPTVYAYPLMLLRGTPLYDRKAKLGIVESTDVNVAVNRVQTNIPHVISSDSFTVEDWQAMAAMAEALDEYNQEQAELMQRQSVGKMKSTLRHTLFSAGVEPASDAVLPAKPPKVA